MFYSQIKTDNSFNNTISSDLGAASAAVCYIGYDNGTEGRVNLKIKGPQGVETISNNLKVAQAPYSNNFITCNYTNGDFFYNTTTVEGQITITITNLNGESLKGRGLVLKLYNVSNNTTLNFSNNQYSLTSGSYCLTFINLTGTVQLLNYYKI